MRRSHPTVTVIRSMASSSSQSNGRLSRSPTPASHTSNRSYHARSSSMPLDMHWMFRSNIPRRRGQPLPTGSDVHRRDFFGMGEVLGVIANPAETVRSLGETRKALEEARRDLSEARERAQLRPAHTFSRLPGFFERRNELRTLQRLLEGDPSFTVLFGASSVGKTALLREVLSKPDYHVLHFDLRIAGFADLSSLYISLSSQMEQYFEAVSRTEGYEDFEKEAWGFKHDRLTVERRIAEAGPDMGHVKTSDVARLMELFQSSLLKYWEFVPEDPTPTPPVSEPDTRPTTSTEVRRVPRNDASSEITRVGTDTLHRRDTATSRKPRWSERLLKAGSRTSLQPSKREATEDNMQVPDTEDEGTVVHGHEPRRVTLDNHQAKQEDSEERERKEREEQRMKKRVPVIFFDEAHKLPALIRSTETMKCILDSMLVLTKQDRLCHVVHATSDPFYQTWLRQLNVMQHCKIVTLGDCSKAETLQFFKERILPRVPENQRAGLHFEHLYDAFGGKLAHWSDYITDYIHADGNLSVERSTHFLQAHALLNLHLIHSSQLPAAGGRAEPVSAGESRANMASGSGFRIYSPLSQQHPHNGDGGEAPGYSADFSATQLLRVMSRLAQPGVRALPYFGLCREMGVVAVDGMVKGRILELRWTETITKEGDERPTRFRPPTMHQGGSESTPIDRTISGEWVAVSPEQELPPEEEPIVVGPLLVPTTPIMHYAMREVVQEYEDVGTVSEYASLSDGDPQEY